LHIGFTQADAAFSQGPSEEPRVADLYDPGLRSVHFNTRERQQLGDFPRGCGITAQSVLTGSTRKMKSSGVRSCLCLMRRATPLALFRISRLGPLPPVKSTSLSHGC